MRAVSGLLRFLLSLLVIFCGPLEGEALAHELDVDSLAIRLSTRSGTLEGQALLDPEITRPGAAEHEVQGLEHTRESERLLAFVREHILFRTGDQPLPVTLELRELYVKGGAVPGDSVLFRASLPQDTRALSVTVMPPLQRLALAVSIDGEEKATELLSGGDLRVIHELEPPRVAPRRVEPASAGLKEHAEDVAGHIATGFLHIVPFGWDHVLFVLALTLGALGRYSVLALEMTAFTVAHALTLGLGALGWILVPAQVVEPLIAFSIAAMAFSRLRPRESRSGRYLLVAFFGLLHGLGFAGALHELGFAGGSFAVFLGSFHLGVELGQFLVLGVTLLVFRLFFRARQVDGAMFTTLARAIGAFGFFVGVARVVG